MTSVLAMVVKCPWVMGTQGPSFLVSSAARPGIEVPILMDVDWMDRTSVWFFWSLWLWVRASWDNLVPALPVRLD